MISTARSTKNWSSTPQDSDFKPLEGHNLSPDNQKKALGDKDLGQVLNEIADPNYVDPAKKRSAGKKDLDKDAFFKLMLAQIKYQNPQQPMESHEMAAHLAQFTSLEQLYNVNENLAAMKKQADPNQSFAAVNFIGKSVVADASQIFRAKGDTGHEVKFRLPTEAQKVNVAIIDGSGKEVRKITINNGKKGENAFSWNGVLDDGSTARAGEYNLKFEAVDGSGKPVTVETKTSGKVTGVTYSATGPVLLMGKQTLRMSDVRRIEDDQLARAEMDRTEQLKAPMGAPSPTPGAQGTIVPGASAAAPFLPASAPENSAESAAAPEIHSEILPLETSGKAPQSVPVPHVKPKLMEPKRAGAAPLGAPPSMTSNMDEISTQGSGMSGRPMQPSRHASLK